MFSARRRRTKIWGPNDAFFFCDLNIPPRDTYPKTKISQKQKIFFGKIALNFYKKISKTKGNSFEQKIPPPPGIRNPELSKKQR